MVHRRSSRSATCISKSEAEILPPHPPPGFPSPSPNPIPIQMYREFYDMRRLRRKLSRTSSRRLSATGRLNLPLKSSPPTYGSIRRYAIPPLTRRDGSTAISDQDKVDTFLNAFFPPPPAVDTFLFPLDDSNSTDSTTAEGEAPPRLFPVRPFQDVIMREVKENLKSPSQTSAPGSSGTSLRALRWA